MARVGRLAGALLAETQGVFYLVGNTKMPCDWPAAGFEPPVRIDALAQPYLRLSPVRAVEVAEPYLSLPLEGEALPKLLAQRLLIERNGSVSDRLWRLIWDPEGEGQEPEGVLEARWLHEMPGPIWQIIRERVLKCT